MAARSGTERRRLAGQVLVRLPAATATRVRAEAETARLTGAAWIRRLLVDRLGEAPAEAAPVRARRPSRPAPTVDVIAVAGLRESVGEAVGTLRQVAGLDRSRGGARLAEIDAALDHLLAAVVMLDDAKASLMRRESPETAQ